MTGRIRVRSATPADADTVLAMRVALIHETELVSDAYRLRDSALPSTRRLIERRLGSATEVTLFAEEGGLVVGMLRCAE